MLKLPKQQTALPLATPQQGTGRLLLFAAVCAAAGLLVLAVDLPVSLAFTKPEFFGSSEVMRLFTLSEVFAHGTGVALICLTVLVLDRARRRCVLRLVASAFGSGIAADVVKLLVPRIRPGAFAGDDILDTFRYARLPQIEPIDAWALASFPSAHTATAVGLAVALSRLYPHGRWLFVAFTVLAAMQRISARAHWPSDALFGAAIGFVISAIVFDARLAGGWFTRWESSAPRRSA